MDDLSKKAQLHAVQYFFVDGTFEFSMGGLCLLLGFYFYLQHRLTGRLAGEMMAPFFILVVLGGGWGINRLVMAMKARLTFPRTGYVNYRTQRGLQPRWRIALSGGLGVLFAAFAGWLAVRRPAGLDWLPLLTGLGFGLAFGLFAWRTALPRFYALAVVILAVGMAFSMLGLEQWAGLVGTYGGIGLLLVLTGAGVLFGYLHRNPFPQEEIS